MDQESRLDAILSDLHCRNIDRDKAIARAIAAGLSRGTAIYEVDAFLAD